jgi:radical SAM protein with 4Fe4S-binding SPASM domain
MRMNYKPVTAVWEITMGCNMRCTHCGSACAEPLKDELTTDEALKLCKDIGDMGLAWVTISGGEPSVRKDWAQIAKALSDNNVIPNMITNGWDFDEEFSQKAEAAGVASLAISIDGLEKTHDSIRKKGSYKRILKAYEIMKKSDRLYPAAITTISKINMNELKDLAKVLENSGVKLWQLQYALPMGNMEMKKDDVIKPGDVKTIIDDIYDIYKDSKMEVQLADCLGYYGMKDYEIRTGGKKDVAYPWYGCTAGKQTFGILHNGDILGCTSVRDKSFIEGNIRKTALKDIWNNEKKFSWCRDMKGNDLEGFCNECIYVDTCLGGCSNTKLTLGGSVTSENKYCVFNQSMQDFIKTTDFNMEDEKLYGNALAYAEAGEMQQALLFLSKVKKEDENILSLNGYINFVLGRYDKSLEVNEKSLKIKADSAYALKGAGLALARMNKLDDGMKYLEKAMKHTTPDYTDPYYDTAVVLYECGKNKEAKEVLDKGLEKFPGEKDKWGALLEKLN